MRWLLLSAVLWLTGCATYEYDLVKPAQFAGHIGGKTDDVVNLAPLLYRLRTVDSYLVLRVENTSAQTIQFLGSQSVVVDPHGQSHPLSAQPIAPGSFMKLILPPLEPPWQRTGPSIVFGLGTQTRGGTESGPPSSDQAPAEPQRLENHPGADQAYYWDWTDQDDVRLQLTYQQDERICHHEFLFHRTKM